MEIGGSCGTIIGKGSIGRTEEEIGPKERKITIWMLAVYGGGIWEFGLSLSLEFDVYGRSSAGEIRS